MELFLADLSTGALVRAIKNNLYEFFGFIGSSASVEIQHNPGWVRWHTRLAHPWFNGLLVRQPLSVLDGSLVEDTIDYFRSRQVDIFTLWLDPDLPEEERKQDLSGRGLHFEDGTPGMALTLDELPAELDLPEGLRIQEVTASDELEAWTRVFVSGYGLPLDWSPDFFRLIADISLEQPVSLGLSQEPQLLNYIGYLDDEPVATSSLFLAAGVAGIYNIATLPPARGRGIGRALTLAPLLEGKRLGYKAGILQSSEMGFGVYERLGFRHLCQMDHYYWRAEG